MSQRMALVRRRGPSLRAPRAKNPRVPMAPYPNRDRSPMGPSPHPSSLLTRLGGDTPCIPLPAPNVFAYLSPPSVVILSHQGARGEGRGQAEVAPAFPTMPRFGPTRHPRLTTTMAAEGRSSSRATIPTKPNRGCRWPRTATSSLGLCPASPSRVPRTTRASSSPPSLCSLYHQGPQGGPKDLILPRPQPRPQPQRAHPGRPVAQNPHPRPRPHQPRPGTMGLRYPGTG